jgi:MFS family permease
MNRQKNLLYYLNFIKDLNFIPVILSPLVLGAGLSLSDLILIIGAFRFTQMIFSIPIGILSDLIGPVKSLRFVSVLFLISICCLIPENLNLWNFIGFNFFSALSVCLLTPASSKFLKVLDGDHENFTQNLSKNLSFRRLGITLSGLIAAGLLILIDVKAIIYIQLIFSFMVLFISYKLDNSLNYRQKVNSLLSHLRGGFKEAPIKEILKVSFLSSSFFIAFDIFIQPVMVGAKVPSHFFPLILALCNFLVFVSLKNVPFTLKHLKLNYYQASIVPLLPLVILFLTNNYTFSLCSLILTIICRPFSVVASAKIVNNSNINYQSLNDSLVNTFSTGITSMFSFLFSHLVLHYSLHVSSLVIALSYALILVISQVSVFPLKVAKKSI